MPSLRILTIEDSQETRDALQAAFVKLGHVAEIVESAEAGLEAFDASRFDAVITDLYLPGMNGDQLARKIKRQDGETPVILLTAYPPLRTPEGIDSILIKPFTVEQLRAALDNARPNGARMCA